MAYQIPYFIEVQNHAQSRHEFQGFLLYHILHVGEEFHNKDIWVFLVWKHDIRFKVLSEIIIPHRIVLYFWYYETSDSTTVDCHISDKNWNLDAILLSRWWFFSCGYKRLIGIDWLFTFAGIAEIHIRAFAYFKFIQKSNTQKNVQQSRSQWIS